MSSNVMEIPDAHSRKDYSGCPGELVELLLAQVIYQCLINEGFFTNDAISSLCERVGVENSGFISLNEVVGMLEYRWKMSIKFETFHQELEMIQKRISNELNATNDKVELICQQFEQDNLLEASLSLAIMASLPQASLLPHAMRDICERSLLHHVTSIDGARLLIELCPCSSLVNVRQQEGFKPIHHANSIKLVNYLVKHGADVNSRSRSGFTPLFLVDSAPSAMNLLKLGADAKMSNTYYKHNALHFTASHGLWDVVWCLLRAGADATLRGKDGYTPLELCDVLYTNPLPTDTPEHLKALYKVKRMFEIWEETLEEVVNKKNQMNPSGFGYTDGGEEDQSSPQAIHRRRFELFDQRCSRATHSGICHDPIIGLSDASNLPIELTRIIFQDYVGIFNGAYILLEEEEVKESEGRGNNKIDHFDDGRGSVGFHLRRRRRGGRSRRNALRYRRNTRSRQHSFTRQAQLIHYFIVLKHQVLIQCQTLQQFQVMLFCFIVVVMMLTVGISISLPSFIPQLFSSQTKALPSPQEL